ncbi:MAG: hypothetical protein AAGJ12_15815 [Bacteroidota bacterium]
MIEPTRLEEISEWITESYGSEAGLRQQLNHIVFMLHFLQEDVFSPREVQDAVELLKGLEDVLAP